MQNGKGDGETVKVHSSVLLHCLNPPPPQQSMTGGGRYYPRVGGRETGNFFWTVRRVSIAVGLARERLPKSAETTFQATSTCEVRAPMDTSVFAHNVNKLAVLPI